jgi:hypothetical protein
MLRHRTPKPPESARKGNGRGNTECQVDETEDRESTTPASYNRGLKTLRWRTTVFEVVHSACRDPSKQSRWSGEIH